LSDAVPIQSGLKERDALLPLPINFTSEYATRKVQENKNELELNGTHQFWSILVPLFYWLKA
jgi:hypothetical protein